MEGAHPDDFGAAGGVRQTAQRFSAHPPSRPQLPPYPPIKQKPRFSSSASSPPASLPPSGNERLPSSVFRSTDHHPQSNLSSNTKSELIKLQSIELSDALRRQLQIKAQKQPFVFTLMVVGASGLGKSTFVNQLFECPLYDEVQHPAHLDAAEDDGETMRVRIHPVQLQEHQVQLTLNLVDTPGFGDTLNGSTACDQVLRFIEQQLDSYLQAETRLKSHRQLDQRVHCCLYFIQPGRHRPLRPLDVTLLKKLQTRVNLVPVIAKADTLTATELRSAKQKVLQQLADEQIQVYDFPDCCVATGLTDEDLRSHCSLKSRMPFAIVSGDQIECDANGSRHRVRKYPWGKVEVDNLEHSDFAALKRLIINYHMLDMIERTNCVFYETYRKSKLSSLNKTDDQSIKNPLAQMEEERKDYESKMQVMKDEMEVVFEAKVKEKVKRLEDSKVELKKREEQMERQVSQLNFDLQERRKQFAKEREAFEMVHKEMEQLRSASIDCNAKDLIDAKEKKKEKKKSLF